MGDTYCSTNEKKKPEKSKAVDALKRAVELVAGENRKANIALTLKEILEELGRDDEIEPYRIYLMD